MLGHVPLPPPNAAPRVREVLRPAHLPQAYARITKFFGNLDK